MRTMAAIRSAWFHMSRSGMKNCILLLGTGYVFAWLTSVYMGYHEDGMLRTLLIYQSGGVQLNVRLLIWIFTETILILLSLELFFNHQLKNMGSTILKCGNKKGYYRYLWIQTICYVTIQCISLYGGSFLYLLFHWEYLPVNHKDGFFSQGAADDILCLINYEWGILLVIIWTLILGSCMKRAVIGYAAVLSVQLASIFLYGRTGMKMKYLPFIQGMFCTYQQGFTALGAFVFLTAALTGSAVLLYIIYRKNFEKLL